MLSEFILSRAGSSLYSFWIYSAQGKWLHSVLLLLCGIYFILYSAQGKWLHSALLLLYSIYFILSYFWIYSVKSKWLQYGLFLFLYNTHTHTQFYREYFLWSFKNLKGTVSHASFFSLGFCTVQYLFCVFLSQFIQVIGYSGFLLLYTAHIYFVFFINLFNLFSSR